MEDRLIVTASPHIREATTTRGLMGNVVIALLPAVLAAGLIFGKNLRHSLAIAIKIEEVFIRDHPQLAYPVEPDEPRLLHLGKQLRGIEQCREHVAAAPGDGAQPTKVIETNVVILQLALLATKSARRSPY